MARLKQETEAVRRVHEAEFAQLKQQTEEVENARKAEIASLRRQLEEALQARKTADTSKAKAKAAGDFANIEFGNYHALVIGINNYKYLPKLTTAINDAKGVAKVLKDEYGFKVTTLIAMTIQGFEGGASSTRTAEAMVFPTCRSWQRCASRKRTSDCQREPPTCMSYSV